MTSDHVVPRSKGGPNQIWNLKPCCYDCNQLKADSEWREHCEDCNRIWRHFDYVFAPQNLERR